MGMAMVVVALTVVLVVRGVCVKWGVFSTEDPGVLIFCSFIGVPGGALETVVTPLFDSVVESLYSV